MDDTIGFKDGKLLGCEELSIFEMNNVSKFEKKFGTMRNSLNLLKRDEAVTFQILTTEVRRLNKLQKLCDLIPNAAEFQDPNAQHDPNHVNNAAVGESYKVEGPNARQISDLNSGDFKVLTLPRSSN